MKKTVAQGTVVRGHRIASGQASDNPFGESTIKLQMPLFKERGLDLSAYYPGTLNVEVTPKQFRVLVAEPQYRGMKWHPDFPAEDFYILPCVLVYAGTKYRAYVYYPDPRKKLGHQHNRHTLEVLAPFVPDIGYGDSVTLSLDPADIEFL